MSSRPINFAAGPAKLPAKVLKRAQDEMLDWHGTGMSIMELSHRGPEWKTVLDSTRENFRRMLNVPDTHEVLFLQGGGTGEFAAVPLNLFGGDKKEADYLVTGLWSNKAVKEAQKYGKINVVNEISPGYSEIPDRSTWKLNPNAAYFYYCDNETVNGVEFPDIPDVGDVPIVCDMSSNILTRKVDVSKFGIIWAVAQKNIGCTGVTLVIVRKDLLGNPHPHCPEILDFTVMSKTFSMPNTPCTWSIYFAGLVFDWMEEEGGLDAFEKHAVEKSSMLYNALEEFPSVYRIRVKKGSRSRINVPFEIVDADGKPSEERLAKFLKDADAQNMAQLRGHRSTGGIRASLYNSLPLEEVKVLVDFVRKFGQEHA